MLPDAHQVTINNGRIQPHVCTARDSKVCFQVIQNRCRFDDRQLIKLQKSPDNMLAGQVPCTASLVAFAAIWSIR